MPADTYQPNPDLLAYAQQGRASYRAMIPRAGDPDPVKEVRDLEIPAAHLSHPLAARLYLPSTPSSEPLRPVVLFMHGGGFICGDLDTHDVMLRALAQRSGALVVSLAYRLAPEAPFPAALEDTFAALEWLAQHAASLNGDNQRVIVCGDSAGGNLAAAVCVLARERGGPPIAGQLLFYPNLDDVSDNDSWRALGDRYFPTRAAMELTLQCYVPGPLEQRLDPLVVPLRAQARGLPPALVITAGLDPLKDEGQAYAAKLREAGIAAQATLYPDVEHGFVQFFKEARNQPMGGEALGQAARFITACR